MREKRSKWIETFHYRLTEAVGRGEKFPFEHGISFFPTQAELAEVRAMAREVNKAIAVEVRTEITPKARMYALVANLVSLDPNPPAFMEHWPAALSV